MVLHGCALHGMCNVYSTVPKFERESEIVRESDNLGTDIDTGT